MTPQLLADFTPIHELPPNHPAVAYLLGRGFDPNRLWESWRVGYCDCGRDVAPVVRRRIVIPIFDIGSSTASAGLSQILAGWLARAIGPEEPKYLFCRGMKKSRLLYGLPWAVGSTDPVFVVEGPADCWRIGSGAVALVGKTLSSCQQSLLVDRFPGHPIVVFLDADAREEAAQLCRSLRPARVGGAGDNRVVCAALPPGRKDPGDCTSQEIAAAVAYRPAELVR